jgi:hypothetical protein
VIAALWDELEAEDLLGEFLAGPFGAGRSPVTFGTGAPLLLNCYLALGADLRADPSTWVWTDVSQYVRFKPAVTVTTGRRDESSLVTPGSASLTFDNTDGRFSRKNPTGPYYGLLSRNTPIRVTINAGSATYTAVEQYVNEWPARWDKSQSDFTVPVQCGGVLRRLGQGAKALHSTEFRQIMSEAWVDSVKAYWPLEGGSTATSGANVIPGGPSFNWTGTAPTTASGGPAGSEALWTFDTATDAVGIVGAYDSLFDGDWSFQMVFNMTAAPTLNPTISLMPIVELRGGGSLPKWRITLDPTARDLLIEGFNGLDVRLIANTFDLDTFFGSSAIYGHNCVITLYLSNDGLGNVVYESWLYSPDDVGNTPYLVTSGSVAGSVSNASSVRVCTGYATRPGWVFGHFMFFDGGWVLAQSDVNGLLGYPGETALARMTRLCGEEGLSFQTIGDPYDGTEAMGPQPAATLLDILRECEAADGGVLCEKNFGLAYQTRLARYNAGYDLVVDADAGQADTLNDADDDQQLRNHWEVTRKNGSMAIAEDTASIAAEGRYDDTKTVNVETDGQLQAIANWLLALGTDDDLRWPNVGLNFASQGGSQLVDQWTAADLGARMRVDNVPGIVDIEAIDVFIEGKTETFDEFSWRGAVNTSPARLWDVMRSNGPGNNARCAPTQTLAADLDSTSTTLTAATASGPLMALKASFPDDFPYDIAIGGERMTVTDVTGGSSPQTLTVVRSVNGVVKSHTAGDQIGLFRPGVIGR